MASQSNIRIIGGKWRSRKVDFASQLTLRPTPDRVRETLFNWLMPYINGAVCLDLFAGSGVLGLEALSRGARVVTSVELERSNCQQLELMGGKLGADELQVVHADVLFWLAKPGNLVDIVFVDPPYKAGLLPKVFRLLEQHNWLKLEGLVYFEHDEPVGVEQLPETWSLWRESKAGNVYYYLAKKER